MFTSVKLNFLSLKKTMGYFLQNLMGLSDTLLTIPKRNALISFSYVSFQKSFFPPDVRSAQSRNKVTDDERRRLLELLVLHRYFTICRGLEFSMSREEIFPYGLAYFLLGAAKQECVFRGKPYYFQKEIIPNCILGTSVYDS